MGNEPDIDTGPTEEEQKLEAERKQQDLDLQKRQIEGLRRRRTTSMPSIFDLTQTLG